MSKPKCDIINIKEHKDGSATFSFEINSEFKKSLQKIYGEKKFSKKLFKKAIMERINDK